MSPLSASPALDCWSARDTGSMRSSKNTWRRNSSAPTIATVMSNPWFESPRSRDHRAGSATRSRRQYRQRARADDRHVPSHPDGGDCLRRAEGLDTQLAGAADEATLLDHEGLTGVRARIAQAVSADRTRSAAGRDVLEQAVIVPVPHLQTLLVEQHGELRLHTAQGVPEVAGNAGLGE